MNEDYVAGFMAKAAELGVDPEGLVKHAQQVPNFRARPGEKGPPPYSPLGHGARLGSAAGIDFRKLIQDHQDMFGSTDEGGGKHMFKRPLQLNFPTAEAKARFLQNTQGLDDLARGKQFQRDFGRVPHAGASISGNREAGRRAKARAWEPNANFGIKSPFGREEAISRFRDAIAEGKLLG